MLNCNQSTTTGVILGATSTMPIETGDGGGISNILNSALLNKQLGRGQYYDGASQNGLQVHDHLKSASMLKGQFY